LIIVLSGCGVFDGKLKQIESKYEPLKNIQAVLENPKEGIGIRCRF
jgi:hypothetical protein